MATYIRLTDYKDSQSKEEGFFKPENRYEASQDDFEKIPGSPIAYWVSDKVKEIFKNSKKLGEFSKATEGIKTGNNELFIRQWYEIELNKFSYGLTKDGYKWYPHHKGGEYQKWFGNNESVINWLNDGFEIKNSLNSGLQGSKYYFESVLSWSKITMRGFAIRYIPRNYLFDSGSPSLCGAEEAIYFSGLLNTKIAKKFLYLINPTINFQVGDVSKFPIIFPKDNSIKEKIDTLTQECIYISKEEWDSRETSWDFRTNPLVRMKNEKLKTQNAKLEDVYNAYCEYGKEKFYKLHSNEEELNRLFIDIYELQDELTPNVDLKDITILKAESFINDSGKLEFKADEIIKQFISYAVGCMFGRYSLEKSGLCIADLEDDTKVSQMIDETKVSFPIDDDNVIPVLEDDYFSDDIASRVVNFVKVVFGEQNLSENINFIEKSLGKTIRTYMVKDFYEDHIKRYKKRPIYWMVSSPKKEFMSLSYMHRYKSDLFALVQNSYLREYITKLEATKEVLHSITIDENSSVKDKKDADKRVKAIETKLKEIISFDRDVLTSYAQNKIEIDLDDGVKVNYSKFKDVLYTIKGLDKE